MRAMTFLGMKEIASKAFPGSLILRNAEDELLIYAGLSLDVEDNSELVPFED